MNPWLRRFAGTDDPDLRLFCFHPAGGSASMYQSWPAHLPSTVDVVAVQLPGREGRFAEDPYERMTPLVATLTDVLAPLLDLPFVFFGHSMGARVAFSLAHALRARLLPGPRKLIVAGSPAPALGVPVPAWNGPDDGLVRYMADLGGTPPEVMTDPELLGLVLPTLRADLTVVATWDYPDPEPLDCGLRALAGRLDPYASPDRMAAWGRETRADFALDVMPGGHFFVRTDAEPVLRTVRDDLTTVMERGANAAR